MILSETSFKKPKSFISSLFRKGSRELVDIVFYYIREAANKKDKLSKPLILCSSEELMSEIEELTTAEAEAEYIEFKKEISRIAESTKSSEVISNCLEHSLGKYITLFKESNETIMYKYFNRTIVLRALENITNGEFLFKQPVYTSDEWYDTEDQVVSIDFLLNTTLEEQAALSMRRKLKAIYLEQIKQLTQK